jgi:hypothetical protein
VVRQADAATKKIDGLRKLIEHFRELEERRIHFVSPFMGPAENMVIPDNRLTRLLAPSTSAATVRAWPSPTCRSFIFPTA